MKKNVTSLFIILAVITFFIHQKKPSNVMPKNLNYYEIKNDHLNLRFHDNNQNEFGRVGFNGLSIKIIDDQSYLNIPHYSLFNFEFIIFGENQEIKNPRAVESLKQLSRKETDESFQFSFDYKFGNVDVSYECDIDKNEFLEMKKNTGFLIDCQYKFKSYNTWDVPITFFFASYINYPSQNGFYFFENGEYKYFESPEQGKKGLIAEEGVVKPDFWAGQDSEKRFSSPKQITVFNNGYRIKSTFYEHDPNLIRTYLYHVPTGGGWAAHDYGFTIPKMDKGVVYSVNHKIHIASGDLFVVEG